MAQDIKKHLVGLVFAGGGGTRLWPFSTNAHPKQFMKFFGSKRTLLQETFDRIKDLIPPERIFVVTTTAAYAKEVRKQLPKIPKKQIIVEPSRRNTAMATALGVAAISKADPAAVIANFWADHRIADKTAYLRTLLAAARAASDGKNLVATGVTPTSPHTGLGYIRKGRLADVYHDVSVFKLEKFAEKPGLATAKKMVSSGSYLWNVGLFVWRADAILSAFQKHAPDFYPLIKKAKEVIGTGKEATVLPKIYKQAPETSIDYAVAEKAKNFLVVQGEFDWSDVGDFAVVWDLSKQDKGGNVFAGGGEWLGVETKESFILADEGKFVGTVGVSDMVIVVQEDKILVVPRSRAQEVKKLVKELQAKGKRELL